MTTTSIKPKNRVRFTDEAIAKSGHLRLMIQKAGKNDFLVLEVSDKPSSGSGMPIAILEMPVVRGTGRDAFDTSLLEEIL